MGDGAARWSGCNQKSVGWYRPECPRVASSRSTRIVRGSELSSVSTRMRQWTATQYPTMDCIHPQTAASTVASGSEFAGRSIVGPGHIIDLRR